MSAANKAFVTRYLEALSGKDKPPDALNRYIADSDQDLKDHIAFFEAAFPRYELKIIDMLAEGNKVVVRGRFIGTHKGELMGIPPTNKTVEADAAIIYEVEDGKIVSHWLLADQAGLLQQLGVVPEKV